MRSVAGGASSITQYPSTRSRARSRAAKAPTSMARRLGPQLGRHPLQHPAVDVVGGLLPPEDAHSGEAVERDVAQRREELVPVHLAVADLVVLVDPGVDAGRIDDVSVAD